MELLGRKEFYETFGRFHTKWSVSVTSGRETDRQTAVRSRGKNKNYTVSRKKVTP